MSTMHFSAPLPCLPPGGRWMSMRRSSVLWSSLAQLGYRGRWG